MYLLRELGWGENATVEIGARVCYVLPQVTMIFNFCYCQYIICDVCCTSLLLPLRASRRRVDVHVIEHEFLLRDFRVRA